MPEYRGNTTLIFSPDHGRGTPPQMERSRPKNSRFQIHLDGFSRARHAALGERSNIQPLMQSQIAATLAAFLGEDYVAAVPKAGKPIADVLPH
jgi:hypothetical protein